MSEGTREPVVSPPEKKHETTDTNVNQVFAVGAGLAGTIVLILVVVYFLAGHYEAGGRRDPATVNPLGARRNAEPLNQRLEEIRQPRLEGLQRLEGDPPWMRSSLPLPTGNSPEFHADDMGADRQPRLQSYGWVDKNKGIAHIPIADAMRAAEKLNLLPTQPGARALPRFSGADRPTEANSGQPRTGEKK